MQIKVLAFAQAADALGFREQTMECDPSDTARQIIERLGTKVSLETLRAAVDEEYVDWDQPIGEARELALIPPVSGG